MTIFFAFLPEECGFVESTMVTWTAVWGAGGKRWWLAQAALSSALPSLQPGCGGISCSRTRWVAESSMQVSVSIMGERGSSPPQVFLSLSPSTEIASICKAYPAFSPEQHSERCFSFSLCYFMYLGFPLLIRTLPPNLGASADTSHLSFFQGPEGTTRPYHPSPAPPGLPTPAHGPGPHVTTQGHERCCSRTGLQLHTDLSCPAMGPAKPDPPIPIQPHPQGGAQCPGLELGREVMKHDETWWNISSQEPCAAVGRTRRLGTTGMDLCIIPAWSDWLL